MARFVDREYLTEMRAACSIMFALAKEEFDSVTDFSKAAKLSDQTIYNLQSGKTRLPQHYTLVKLARATGCHIEVKRGVIRLSSARKHMKKRKTA